VALVYTRLAEHRGCCPSGPVNPFPIICHSQLSFDAAVSDNITNACDVNIKTEQLQLILMSICRYGQTSVMYQKYRIYVENIENTRMWANAQPDGRPAEHRWRPQFNAAKFG